MEIFIGLLALVSLVGMLAALVGLFSKKVRKALGFANRKKARKWLLIFFAIFVVALVGSNTMDEANAASNVEADDPAEASGDSEPANDSAAIRAAKKDAEKAIELGLDWMKCDQTMDSESWFGVAKCELKWQRMRSAMEDCAKDAECGRTYDEIVAERDLKDSLIFWIRFKQIADELEE